VKKVITLKQRRVDLTPPCKNRLSSRMLRLPAPLAAGEVEDERWGGGGGGGVRNCSSHFERFRLLYGALFCLIVPNLIII
jgi:hypothetical protein